MMHKHSPIFCSVLNWSIVMLASVFPGNAGMEHTHETLNLTNLTYDVSFNIYNSDGNSKLELLMDNEYATSFNYTLECEENFTNFTIVLTALDPGIVSISSETEFQVSCYGEFPATNRFFPNISFSPLALVHGDFLVSLSSGIIGKTGIDFKLIRHSYNTTDVTSTVTPDDSGVSYDAMVVSRQTFAVTVIRQMRPVDVIFQAVVYCVQIFVMTGFGAKLDLGVVKENLLRPIAPGIGLSCQYILMPLIAFTVAKLVPIDNEEVALGIFIAGVCPGGGASNMYSYLLKGDLSLSVTMTALSTVAALALMPLWVYTLGRLFNLEHGVTIPFHMVVVSLSILITPLVFGVFLRQKFPKTADRVQKLLKPVVVIMSFVLLVVGIYSNLYIFRLFKPRIIIAGLLLPYVGYLVGGGVAAICRQSWKRIKTISIETGMQNTMIGYILLINSFPAPDGDIAAVGPVASAVMTPLPPFTITVIYLIYQCCKKKYSPVAQEDPCRKKNATSDDPAAVKLTAL